MRRKNHSRSLLGTGLQRAFKWAAYLPVICFERRRQLRLDQRAQPGRHLAENLQERSFLTPDLRIRAGIQEQLQQRECLLLRFTRVPGVEFPGEVQEAIENTKKSRFSTLADKVWIGATLQEAMPERPTANQGR